MTLAHSCIGLLSASEVPISHAGMGVRLSCVRVGNLRCIVYVALFAFQDLPCPHMWPFFAATEEPLIGMMLLERHNINRSGNSRQLQLCPVRRSL